MQTSTNHEVRNLYPEREPCVHPRRPGDSSVLHGDNSYLCDRGSVTFPGPLMSNTLQMQDLVRFIQRKTQECLQQVDEPDQKEAYFFWQIMELFCNKNGNLMLAEVALLLFKGYSFLRKRLGGVKNQDGWCLPLAQLLCAAGPQYERLVEMGKKLDSEGQTFAAHLCYLLALKELSSSQGSSFELIGCKSQSAMREAIERTEVYEYVCSLTSGLAQTPFQMYKCYHAGKLAESGLYDKAFAYCETIASTIATFSSEMAKTTLERTIELSERLHQGKGEEPEWLKNLHQLYTDQMFKADSECGFMSGEMLALQFPRVDRRISPQDEFESRYIPGELLGRGGFGSVHAGVRKADGKQVAIKYVCKGQNDEFITMPGKTHSLPLEVALMEMVSKPFHCKNVLELIEWFDTADCYVLVLERPSPCIDVLEFCECHKGRLSEPLARHIMHQVVQAVRHCCDRGVFHGDVKAENLLINTNTLDVKLKDFGCGDLLKDTPYTRYAGTWAFCPPEWICEGEYLGRPATVWSLGILLFNLVCRDLPLHTENDNVYQNLHLVSGLSGGCHDLIWWCLEQDPFSRPTF